MLDYEGRTYGCPVEITLDALGGKWKAVILARIKEGENRFGVLLRAIPQLSARVQTQRLRELERDGLVIRTASELTSSATSRGRRILCGDYPVGNVEDDNSRYCFADAGDLYLVYLPEGGTTDPDLSGVAADDSNDRAAPTELGVSWYDPRNGGELRPGSVTSVEGGATVSLGMPPNSPTEDWLAVVRR